MRYSFQRSGSQYHQFFLYLFCFLHWPVRVFIILNAAASLCASTDFIYKRHVPLRNVDLLSEALNLVIRIIIPGGVGACKDWTKHEIKVMPLERSF